MSDRMLLISDDDHLQASCCLSRIQATADLLCNLDEDGSMSSEVGLLKHTIYSAAETIIQQVEAAGRFLDKVNQAKDAA